MESPPSLAPGRPALARDAPGGPPRSAAFDDVYYSAEDGLSEAHAVFVAGCGLPDAWTRLRPGQDFVIGELGFGTGLNLLAAWRAWRRARPPGAWLHFVSVEGYPLAREDAAAALATFPEVGDLASQLLAAWPPRIKGVHRRRFDADGLTLTLACLEAREALAALDFAADAWFLDGFAPARNPDMWRAEVLAGVAARSRLDAGLASFTVAGDVRRGLEAAGFAVAKKPGHGRKRERLEARLRGPARPPAAAALAPRAAAPDGPVLILGAGVAGASVTRALRRRGVEARVLEAGAAPASGASGNPVALVAPRLDLDDRPAARFHRVAYAYALADYAGADAFRAIGVVRAGRDQADAARLGRLLAAQALPADMAAAIAAADAGGDLGLAADAPALLLPQAGVLAPADWIEAQLAGAAVRLGARVARLDREDAAWVARDAGGAVLGEGAACVIATGAGLDGVAQTRALGLQRTRGQLSLAPVEGPPPDRALAWGPYLAPLDDGRIAFGATYDPWEDEHAGAPRAADDARNLAALRAFAPGLADRIDASRLTARAGVRAAAPDRLALAGAVVDADAFAARFAGLRHGRLETGPAAPLHDGLYLLGGLGSRGFVWAPLLAEALASEMRGEPGALERGAAESMHPARILARGLRRGG